MKANLGSDIKVSIYNRGSRCDEWGEDLGHRAWIRLVGEDAGLLAGLIVGAADPER